MNKFLGSLLGSLFIILAVVTGYAGDITYTYDQLNRLTSVRYADGTTIEYVYDDIGNRLIRNIAVTGSFSVTISPAGAVSAGAKWRVDGGAWQNSGATLPILAVGQHTVEFKDIMGWTTPGSQTVTIVGGQTATAGGTYVQQFGSLSVTINPVGAISAGAQWRVDGDAWQSSGSTLSNLAVGQHVVEFKGITDWTAPNSETVTVSNGQTTTASGAYVQHTGSLSVTINPGGAISAGAQWRVDGGAWQGSGTTVSNLPVGQHTVEFKDTTGWGKPGNQTVAIADSQTSTASGTYIQQFTISTSIEGDIGGTISPTSAIVDYDGSQTFTITPDIYFYIDSIKIDGVPSEATGSYTFANVLANHTISASFTPVPIINARTSIAYTSLQAAYNAALDGDTIKCRDYLLVENFSANRDISVTIDGGYTEGFSSNPNKTSLKERRSSAAVLSRG